MSKMKEEEETIKKPKDINIITNKTINKDNSKYNTNKLNT